MSGFKDRMTVVSVPLITQAVLGTLIAFGPAISGSAQSNKATESPPHGDHPAYGQSLPMRRPVTEAERAVERAARGSVERRNRMFDVLEWLPSVGGERWYANYLDKFGAPRTQCVFRFQDGDLTSRELGHYYLRHPVIEAKPAVEPDRFAGLGAHYGIEDRYTKTMVAHIALAASDAYLTAAGTGRSNCRPAGCRRHGYPG